MTLCIAWIRETPEEELVFATDSTLTGAGEKWNHGVKLFELPRTDCLICFAGDAQRAYPLILNLISAIKHNESLKNPALNIQEVLYSIVDIFTELVNLIFEKHSGDVSHIGGEAKFLFGGWDWRENRFRIWRIYYSSTERIFLFKEETEVKEKARVCVFLGDPETPEYSIAKRADDDYKLLLIERDKFDGKLDLEPLNILVEMCRNTAIREVDGALQIGKVYKSGTTEFFGVMWQSVYGSPTFLGKEYDKHNKPRVRYFDPDTWQIIETEIPKSLVNIEDFKGSPDFEFLTSCYSQEDNFLKQDITERERARLISIFQDHSYTDFVKKAEENLNLKSSVPTEDDVE
ncbi:MAG TPA: hypothetical protein VF297_08075 [Pyrinomonadaceae bacterium]